MNTFVKFLSAGAVALLASASSSFAYDSDPGSGGVVDAKNGKGVRANRYAPQYFRPTQRYYGKGYTVAYRFIPWSDRMRGMTTSSSWDSEEFRLPTNAAATTYANGTTPRITYFYKKPSSASLRGLPDSNSAIATTPKPLPPIGEAPKTEAAPAPTGTVPAIQPSKP